MGTEWAHEMSRGLVRLMSGPQRGKATARQNEGAEPVISKR